MTLETFLRTCLAKGETPRVMTRIERGRVHFYLHVFDETEGSSRDYVVDGDRIHEVQMQLPLSAPYAQMMQ